MVVTITWQHPTDQSTVLILAGVLDHAGAAELRSAMSAAVVRRPRSIVVDLIGVHRIDAVGVGTLVVADRICQQIGINLAVRNPAPTVESLLGMTGNHQPGRRSAAANAETGPLTNQPASIRIC
jgi:anti-sigma B factor antagonist